MLWRSKDFSKHFQVMLKGKKMDELHCDMYKQTSEKKFHKFPVKNKEQKELWLQMLDWK